MEKIQIGSAGHPEQVLQRLEFEAAFMREEGFVVDVVRRRRGAVTYHEVYCRPTDRVAAAYGEAAEQASLVRHHLANAVSDLIVNLWEKKIIASLVAQECGALEPDERRLVARHAEVVLDGGSYPQDGGLGRKVARKGHVLRQVDGYLVENRVLDIDGFVRFRLKDYMRLLESVIEQAVDEFMVEKEYREFILLLKHFLAAQEPRVDRVHVLVSRDGGFRLVDDEGCSISEQFLAECLTESGTKDVNRDDLLISALITIAPRRLKLHLPSGAEGEGLRTLRAVFADRLSVCHGCDLCGLKALRLAEESEKKVYH